MRTGADGRPLLLHTLSEGPLAWLAPPRPQDSLDDSVVDIAADGGADEDPAPELRVSETSASDKRWTFQRHLLDAALDKVVTVDPMRYRTVDPASGAAEYDGRRRRHHPLRRRRVRRPAGRRGGVRGDLPVGGGTIGNVAADAIDRVDRSRPVAARDRRGHQPAAGQRGA